MHVVSTVEELREHLSDWRHAGDHIALVPTMGNLHQGPVSLVRLAREHAERVVVSIFVNPAQFGGSEDFKEDPNAFERDKRRLKRENVDLIFAPDVETMYPFGIDNATSVTVPALTDELCGPVRPGHFDGLTTVMSRLFALVQPDVAVFGQKDYQQQLVVRRMAEDLNLPIEIVTGPIVREDDGLANSAQNQYLSEDERAIAPKLYETIVGIAEALNGGNREFAMLEKDAVKQLEADGFKPDYVSIRSAVDLEEPADGTRELVVVAAAWLGTARLIDNVEVTI